MKETLKQKKSRVQKITQIFRKKDPHPKCALDFSTPFQLLAATVLSAQCTDKRVNRVTPALFKKFRDVEDFANAGQEEVEEIVRSTGFYKNKAKNIIQAARKIVEDFDSKVPSRLEDLITLPGVGRKTANVILGNAFGTPGLTVDTHMIRINGRLGLTRHTDPVKIEFDLMPLVPEKDWTNYSHWIIHHGRVRCFARKPDCPNCEILPFCPAGKKLLGLK